MSAIAGNLASYKTLADGTLRITIDLDEAHSRDFHGLFPCVNCAVAIAPIKNEIAGTL